MSGDPVSVVTVSVAVNDAGEALEKLVGQSAFGLTDVRPAGHTPGIVSWLPDPDNDQNMIVWIRHGEPNTSCTLLLSYPAL